MAKIRIDQLLVKKGLVDSRETAQRLVMAQKVLLGNTPAAKSSQLVDEQTDIRLIENLKYVSRGGFKLEYALDQFGIDVREKTVVDIGASTGGFTDCLLQRDAKTIYAVDVGYGQLAWKLRNDPRVVVIERTNARFLTKDLFKESIDLTVIDVSFIGSIKILEPLSTITAEVVLLLKPQFEAGPEHVPKGGVIRDHEIHRRVLLEFYRQLPSWKVCGLLNSPIAGSSGNREFLVHLRTDSSAEEAALDESKYLKKVEELLP